MTRQHQSALSRLGFRDPDKENPRHGLACEYLQEKMRPYVIASLASRLAQAAHKALDGDKRFSYEPQAFHCSDFHDDLDEALFGRHWYATPSPRDAIRTVADEFIRSNCYQWATAQIDNCTELSSLVEGPSSGAKGFLDVSFRAFFSNWYAAPSSITANFVLDGQKQPLELTLMAGEKRPTVPNPFFLDRYRKRLVNGDCQFAYWGEVRIEPTSPELLLQQIEFYASNLPCNDMIWVLADFDLSDFKRMAQQQFPQLKCFQLGPKFEEWCQARERPEIPEL